MTDKEVGAVRTKVVDRLKVVQSAINKKKNEDNMRDFIDQNVILMALFNQLKELDSSFVNEHALKQRANATLPESALRLYDFGLSENALHSEIIIRGSQTKDLLQLQEDVYEYFLKNLK